MAKSQTIANLNVTTSMDAAGFKAGANNVVIEANNLKNSIARQMRAAEKRFRLLSTRPKTMAKPSARLRSLSVRLRLAGLRT